MPSDPLYDVPKFDGQDDYISDSGLGKIADLLLRMPVEFDLRSSQAHQQSITATFEFLPPGLAHQIGSLHAMCASATVVRTLHANLVAAREALTERES